VTPLASGRSRSSRPHSSLDVDRQFTLFGAYGAVLFMLLSGLLLARFAVAKPQSRLTRA
jgi:hypothetical protein